MVLRGTEMLTKITKDLWLNLNDIQCIKRETPSSAKRAIYQVSFKSSPHSITVTSNIGTKIIGALNMENLIDSDRYRD